MTCTIHGIVVKYVFSCSSRGVGGLTGLDHKSCDFTLRKLLFVTICSLYLNKFVQTMNVTHFRHRVVTVDKILW